MALTKWGVEEYMSFHLALFLPFSASLRQLSPLHGIQLTVVPPLPQGLNDYVLDSVACSLSLRFYCRIETLIVQNNC